MVLPNEWTNTNLNGVKRMESYLFNAVKRMPLWATSDVQGLMMVKLMILESISSTRNPVSQPFVGKTLWCLPDMNTRCMSCRTTPREFRFLLIELETVCSKLKQAKAKIYFLMSLVLSFNRQIPSFLPQYVTKQIFIAVFLF